MRMNEKSQETHNAQANKKEKQAPARSEKDSCKNAKMKKKTQIPEREYESQSVLGSTSGERRNKKDHICEQVLHAYMRMHETVKRDTGISIDGEF